MHLIAPLRRGKALVLAGLAVACLAPAPSFGEEPTVIPTETRRVAKVTGPGPLNVTDQRWNVYGTDLGSMFELDGNIYMTFGDTFGAPRPGDVASAPDRVDRNIQDPTTAVQYADWRSNTMAWFSADKTNPEIGPLFKGMVTDPANPLRAKELLSSRKDSCVNADGSTVAGFCEQTVIPTYGFAVGDRMYLHYMSVKRFNPPEAQETYALNHAGIAYSDNRGQTWTKAPSVTWDGGSNFGQVAAERVGRHVYLFGIPGGRAGEVRLARVDSDKVLKKANYRYWSGSGWTEDEDAAVRLVPPKVGEFSVRWNSHFGKWLMLYTNNFGPGDPGAYLRMSDCLTGPWSEPQLVADGLVQYASLYAPFMPPRWNDGPEVYFAMSIFFNYNVYWIRTKLAGEARPGREPCVSP